MISKQIRTFGQSGARVRRILEHSVSFFGACRLVCRNRCSLLAAVDSTPEVCQPGVPRCRAPSTSSWAGCIRVRTARRLVISTIGASTDMKLREPGERKRSRLVRFVSGLSGEETDVGFPWVDVVVEGGPRPLVHRCIPEGDSIQYPGFRKRGQADALSCDVCFRGRPSRSPSW